MTWDALAKEFAAWRAAGMVLPFWWRDDDAVKDTAQLRQLNDLSMQMGVPVHVAVVPVGLEQSLVSFVRENKRLIPVVHGYGHINHADASAKKCEFPDTRSAGEVEQDLKVGFDALSTAFGDMLQPMFVPPWNRFLPAYLGLLKTVGYKGYSAFTPRKATWAIDGVQQINTHVDPIDWHGTRSLADPDAILNHTVNTLHDRRLGRADNGEPLGFLTHHLVHDPAIWVFCEKFLTTFAAGPTRVWTAAELTVEGH